MPGAGLAQGREVHPAEQSLAGTQQLGNLIESIETKPIQTYPVNVEDDDVLITVTT